MSQINIGSFLKQIRKASGYSVKEAVHELEAYNIIIASKTLYGYESGHTMPNADTFITLCHIYQCENPLIIFKSAPLTKEERALIDRYRMLDDNGKKIMDIVLEAELYRSIEIQNILKLHQQDYEDYE